MPRVTNTRERVRALADELAARGEEPTPTVILRALGKGSPSTVVDELKKWRSTRSAQTSTPVRTAVQSSLASDNGPAALELGRNPKATPTEGVPGSCTTALLQELRATVAGLTEAVAGLGQEIKEQDARYERGLALAYERLGGVQKMALMAIDEAREQARFWKEQAAVAKDDAKVKTEAYRQAMLAAQSEARRLAEDLRKREEDAQRRGAMRPPAAYNGLSAQASSPAAAQDPLLTTPVQTWTVSRWPASVPQDPDEPEE